MKLISIYNYHEMTIIHGAAETLYQLLAEREPNQNISHKTMPTYQEHLEFLEEPPYKEWYLIQDKETVGAIYITHRNEVGIHLFKAYQGKGYGTQALVELMKRHQGPFYANINPENKGSINFFKSFGARHLQNTYIFNE